MSAHERAPLLAVSEEDDATHYRTGLSSAQADSRLAAYGRNAVDPAKFGPGLLAVVWEEVREPMILLLLVVAVLYSALGTPLDAVTICVTVVLVVAVEVATEYRAKTALRKLGRTLPCSVAVLRDGEKKFIPAEELVPGDILFLARGQRVPADGRVLLAVGFSVDESGITGESLPVTKAAAGTFPEEEDDHLAVAKDEVLAPSLVTSGSATVLVQRTGEDMHQYVSRIGLKKVKQPKTNSQKLMKMLAFRLSIVAATVSVTTILLMKIKGAEWKDAILSGLALAFATVPEELPLVAKAVLALSALGLSGKGVLIRRLRAAEALGTAHILVTDKTGTLTKGELAVQSFLVPSNGSLVELEVPDGRCKKLAETWTLLSAPTDAEVPAPLLPDAFDSAFFASLPDSLATSAAAFASRYPVLVSQEPFDPSTRTSSVVRASADGRSQVEVIKGAPAAILQICDRTSAGPIAQVAKESLAKLLESASGQGRAVCLALRGPGGSELLGGAVFADPVLAEAADTIAELEERGIRTIMATGDAAATAGKIASECGIYRGGITASGKEVEDLDDEKLDDIEVCSRMRPEDKLALVQKLQEAGNRVLMLGDGDNDAPALMAADAGICIAGSLRRGDAAVDAAGIVLLAQAGIAGLPPAIDESRRATSNLNKVLVFYLACKLALVLLFICGIILGDGKPPLNPIQTVVAEMIMDLGAGSAYAFEAAEYGVRPGPVFGKQVVFKLMGGGFLLFVVVAGAFFGGQRMFPEEPCIAGSSAFYAWLAAHVLWGLSCRTFVTPLRKQGIFTNLAFLGWVVAVLAIAGLVAFVEPVRVQLGLCLVPLDWAGWIVLAAFGCLFLPYEMAKEGVALIRSFRERRQEAEGLDA